MIRLLAQKLKRKKRDDFMLKHFRIEVANLIVKLICITSLFNECSEILGSAKKLPSEPFQ